MADFFIPDSCQRIETTGNLFTRGKSARLTRSLLAIEVRVLLNMQKNCREANKCPSDRKN
ncbi:MAG: hypothetical protein LKM37_01695 [Bacteroidales bacterium]|nr:hypothetical protein [Bacteroidales bacterium]MCI1733073.1 hypothetical protein [Bacteroidales bacterium]